MEMSETFNRILKLSDERQQLYFLAGKQPLAYEQRLRLDELNRTLPDLWDTYRREVVSSHRVNQLTADQQVEQATSPIDEKAA
jgi:hypothetical protein